MDKCTTRGDVIYRIMFATQSSKASKNYSPTCLSWDRFPWRGSYFQSAKIEVLLMCDLLAKLHNRKIQSILSRRIKISYICNQPIFWLVQVPKLWNRFKNLRWTKVKFYEKVVFKAHSCENVTGPVTFFQKMSYRGYILFRIRFHSNFF